MRIGEGGREMIHGAREKSKEVQKDMEQRIAAEKEARLVPLLDAMERVYNAKEFRFAPHASLTMDGRKWGLGPRVDVQFTLHDQSDSRGKWRTMDIVLRSGVTAHEAQKMLTPMWSEGVQNDMSDWEYRQHVTIDMRERGEEMTGECGISAPTMNKDGVPYADGRSVIDEAHVLEIIEKLLGDLDDSEGPGAHEREGGPHELDGEDTVVAGADAADSDGTNE